MSTEVVDPLDLKLRAIFATLEEHHYRQALQLVSKASKRDPNALIWKALKATCYDRLGRENEASQLCSEVVRATPTDRTILQTVSTIYKGWGMYREICDMYSKACKLKPSDEELASHLFMALVRNDDYKGQQQVALQMHKRFRTSEHCDKYLFWAVMSMILQSNTETTDGNSLSLTLAERIMSKVVEEGRINSYEEIQLCLLVLRAQNKNSDALALLESELGQQIKVQGEVARNKLELLAKLERWREVEELAQRILCIDINDWRCYTFYFDALFKRLMDEGSESRRQEELMSAKAFLRSVAHGNHRGPYMAGLELTKRAAQTGINSGGIVPGLLDYFERFSSKTCCFDDIRPYLSLVAEISNATVDTLLRELSTRLQDENNLHQIQKHLNYLKIERYLRRHEFTKQEEVEKFVEDMLQFYTKALQYGKDLVETEKQYGDDYVILAVHVMISAHRRTGNSSWLLNALSLLEYASSKSKHNFQFKLLLIRLYENLGMISRPIQVFKSMDVKQVQMDTMSHFLVHDLPDFGHFEEAQNELGRTLRFYQSADMECPEMITEAYRYGTFSQIEDFIEFRRRILHSLPRAMALMEIRKLRFMQASTLEEIQLRLMDIMKDQSSANTVDNRDFGVMVDWSNENGDVIGKRIRSRPTKAGGWLWLQLKAFELLAIMLPPRLSGDIPVCSLEEAIAALQCRMDASVLDKELTAEEASNLRIVLANADLLVVAAKNGNQEELQKNLEIVGGTLSGRINQILNGIKNRKFGWRLLHQMTTFIEALQILRVLQLSVVEQSSRRQKGSQSTSIRRLKVLLESLWKENDFVGKFRAAVEDLRQSSKQIAQFRLPATWPKDMSVASDKVSASWADYLTATDNFAKYAEAAPQ